ncbi:MAG: hypothetical protein N2654_05670 [Deltaproteobacteria bacterium]|nr:hypothetical protein [Deltaproteobacteria bacterium]
MLSLSSVGQEFDDNAVLDIFFEVDRILHSEDKEFNQLLSRFDAFIKNLRMDRKTKEKVSESLNLYFFQPLLDSPDDLRLYGDKLLALAEKLRHNDIFIKSFGTFEIDHY